MERGEWEGVKWEGGEWEEDSGRGIVGGGESVHTVHCSLLFIVPLSPDQCSVITAQSNCTDINPDVSVTQGLHNADYRDYRCVLD